MAKHFLYNLNNDLVKEFETFTAEAIKAEILKYLKDNPSDELTHEKELSEKDKIKYVGNEIINFYENNPKSGKPCKVIVKGTRQYYQPLT